MSRLIPFNRKNRNVTNPLNMIDNFFDETLSNLPMLNRNFFTDQFKIDVKEEDNQYLIEAELPGVQKDDIELNLNDDGRLFISVHREESVDEKDKDGNYIHRERRSDSMQRSLYLSDANPDGGVHARLEDGLLKITVEKIDQAKLDNSRKIDIE